MKGTQAHLNAHVEVKWFEIRIKLEIYAYLQIFLLQSNNLYRGMKYSNSKLNDINSYNASCFTK